MSSPVRSSRRALVAALCAVAMLLVVGAGPAFAIKAHIFDSSFGTAGSAAGQFKEPSGVAVNEETGDVYVVDTGNNRIQQFNATGTSLLAAFNGAAAPTGPLSNPSEIAIDNSGNPLDPSDHDVYVSGEVTIGGEVAHVIYKFSASGTYLGQIDKGPGGTAFGPLLGLALDSSGGLLVYQEPTAEKGELDHYSDALENEAGASCTAPPAPRAPSPGLAVDSEGNAFVNTGSREFEKLSSGCATLVFSIGPGGGIEPSSAAAVDPATNEIYLDNVTSLAVVKVVGEPGAEKSELIERFGSSAPGEGALVEGAGIAVDSASPNKLVYVVDRGSDAVKIYREVVRATLTSEAPSGLGPRRATLNGTVNPEGVLVTSCVFEYGETSAYGQSVPCAQSPGAGEAPVAVSATLALAPGHTYHYRLTASDENGASPPGEDESFTLGPGLDGEDVIEVSADAASFQAIVNPHAAATSFYFEYGTTISYGRTVPAPPGIALSPVEGDVNAPVQHVSGLSASTTYHYRLVVVQEGEAFPGRDQTFTTQGPGGALTLPDARAWELVSPPDKHGGVIEAPGEIGVSQAAAGGGAVSYLANAPTEASPAGDAGLVQVLSTRGPAGWSSKDIASPHTHVAGQALATPAEYSFFDEDLSAGLVQPYGLFEAQLSSEASEQTPYLRTLGECAASCYHPLVSAKPGFADALPGFGEEKLCEEENGVLRNVSHTICGPELVGASPDLRHVALISPAALQSGDGREQLYEWSGGGLSLVSRLPGSGGGEGAPAPNGTARLGDGLGLKTNEVEGSAKRAVSADGSRVFWEAQGVGERTLYVRDLALGQTLQLDASEAACGEACASGGGRFQIASADGGSVLFSDPQRLMSDAGQAGTSDLYECALVVEGGRLACHLHDLTAASGGESASVQGSVLGASEDDSSVYFVAEGVLSANRNARGQSASAGAENLYVRRAGATSFIATLAAGDNTNWSGYAENQPARVSASGRWLTFMSEAQLSGYDNHDALSGRPDAEIYEYDAQGGGLLCASCDPSGARPHGVEFARLTGSDAERLVVGQPLEWPESSWVAALAPASPSFRHKESAHQSRYLTESGRVFFDSLDALLPQDVNGNWDVYEREPEGVGSCASGAAQGSCLGLISSGASAQEAAFLDASEGGADAFFLTSAKLSPLDLDANRDVYDAHECTSASPCLPQGAEVPPPCDTEASCKAPASPQPPIFGSPASATFSGPGNPPAVAVRVTKKALTRAQKLAAALKACKRRPRKQRAVCVKRARRSFGGKAVKRSTNQRRPK